MQNDMNTIFNWCERNFISFGRKHALTQILDGYSINNSSMTKVNRIRDLGIPKLTCESHMNQIFKS